MLVFQLSEPGERKTARKQLVNCVAKPVLKTELITFQLPFNLSVGSESDAEEDKEDEQREHGTSYKTPGSRTPSSRFRPLGPLPSSTTPSWELISPSLLQPVNRLVNSWHQMFGHDLTVSSETVTYLYSVAFFANSISMEKFIQKINSM